MIKTKVTKGDGKVEVDAQLRRPTMGPPLSGMLGPRVIEKYMSIPFLNGGRDEKGADCWGLVYLVYLRELGITLPTYGAISATELLAIQRQVETDKTHETWELIEGGEEKPFDIVVMTGTLRPQGGGGLRSALVHMGLVTRPRYVLHTEEGVGVQHIPFKGVGAPAAIKARVREIYRYTHVAHSG